MPATPSRIGFITQPFRIATSGPDSRVEALYGNAARDTEEPLETFFDTVEDAEAMADERMTLLSQSRSLLTVQIDRADTGANVDARTGLPTVRVIDDEQNRNAPGLIVGVGVDMNTDRTTLEVWG
jgi:hypothetical protein